ncbi:unnamed protein product [Brachionus calyciflorus]|uniref:Centrosomal protein of 290kDa coiled-coil region domain-containing protein n=1 Tax=Brachionus calyciflorus TaxID=104777 RepID=A0A813NTX6_9BILA|nr:unnamed protein product [Brachionus calyciflorus]
MAKKLEDLIKLGKIDDEKLDDFCKALDDVEIDAEKDLTTLIAAFKITKDVVLKVHEENKISLDYLQKESEDALKREQDLREQIEYAEKQLEKYQQDPNLAGTREMLDFERLEKKNDEMRLELKETEEKYFLEKSEKEKLKGKYDELEKKITKLTRENERYRDEVQDLVKSKNQFLEQKFRPDQDKIKIINDKKAIINELERLLEESNEENQKLYSIIESNKSALQESEIEMIKTKEEINKLKMLRQQTDSQVEEFKKENDILKSQIENYNLLLKSHTDQESAIMMTVDNAVKEYKTIIEDKKKEIDHLNELITHLRENLGRQNMDSDKVTVSALQKVLKTKENEIQVLKKQLEDSTKEMEKSRNVIDALTRTMNENAKMYSKSAYYNINKQADAKILHLEEMLKDTNSRLRESEDQLINKEKELVEALNRLRDYESGDYQLQQAVNEIKGLKNQIKVRDRDLERKLIQLNKLDDTLKIILEENDDLRAKLGMDPREKLDIEELKDLRFNRDQENRAQIYVLQRENEELLEVQNQLRKKIRLLAKQVRSTGVIASILDDEYETDEPKKEPKQKDPKQSEEKNSLDPKMFKDLDNLKKRNEIQLQHLLELQKENEFLKRGLTEVNDEIRSIGMRKTKGKELVIKCPTLEKLLNELESSRSSRANMKSYDFLNKILADTNADSIALALKSEIDFLQGRNEELRSEVVSMKSELNKAQTSLIKSQEEIDRLNSDVRIMNSHSAAKDIFQPFKLPAGMSPSSQDIISALNEYLVDTLQELEENQKISAKAEKELESLRRKFSVARHQMGLLYKDHIEKTREWKVEKENFLNTIKKLNDTVAVDSVKLQEYDRLLETLQKDESDIRNRIAENSRQMFVIRSNEKQLQRKCQAYEEINSMIMKENKKLKVELVEAEIAVQQRLGYLDRYKDLADFKINSLQTQLEECVPVTKLETVNKEYNDVVLNYRQLLDRQDKSEQLTISLHQTEELNKKYQNELEFLKNELENAKDKANILEETLERMKILPIPGYSMNNSLENDSSMISMAKRLTALEMKELNERQKADHAQRMYDQQRNLLREIENRNIELENNFTQLSKKYLHIEKSEQLLREQLTQYVPKSLNDQDKAKIKELEKQEVMLKLEISRLRELTEITLYQAASTKFINEISKAQSENLGLIDFQSLNDDTSQMGKLHRQLILMQISEATAIRKLQHAESKIKKLEAQLVRAEQKYDRDSFDYFSSKKEFISKITYLRSTVQDLRHKYAGSIPLRQTEKFNEAKEKLTELKKELNEKLLKLNEEKHELNDRIAEYTARVKEIELLKKAAITGKDGSVRFNEKFLDSFKKIENIKMMNLKLERANQRFKDEIKFLEEMNRKHELTIISLEEQNLKLENEYDQKLIIWEHREADLERTIDHLRKQHQMIENLAISFEEISGNMPDQTLPISNQLEQAMNIIRSHIKLLAEAKVQADLSKKRVQDLENLNRKLENEVNLRDKAITELRLRLPATLDRDLLVKSSMNRANSNSDSSETPVKAAQATIESLQNLIKQKEETILKYQDMLKLARDEITNINKQHELEMNNLLDKLNLTRESNLKKLRQELKMTNGASSPLIITRAQLNRLQELEEVTVEQDNTISALNQKIKKLMSEIETWKTRHDMLKQSSNDELTKLKKEHEGVIDDMNVKAEELRDKISEKEQEINAFLNELEKQKELNNKSPSAEIKQLVDKLKKQLNEKEEIHNKLKKELVEMRSDMVELARTNLTSLSHDQSNEKKIRDLIDKTSAEYQDKLNSVSEDMVKLKKDLKEKNKQNEELNLELNHLKSQIKSKDGRIKKLTDENQKLIDDAKIYSTNKIAHNFNADNKTNDVESLKRQIRILEEKLKKQKQNMAERPYVESGDYKSRSKSPKRIETEKVIIKTVQSKEDKINTENNYSLRTELEHWKTRYNYVLSENSILLRQKNDLEVEIARLKREVNINAVEVLNENKVLREEIEKSKGFKNRSYSPASKTDVRSENKSQVSTELQKLRQENEVLKQKSKKVDELERLVEYLRQSKNEDADTSASSTASSIRKIGESGKSSVELEKTIALMKKIILKLQKENDALKNK